MTGTEDSGAAGNDEGHGPDAEPSPRRREPAAPVGAGPLAEAQPAAPPDDARSAQPWGVPFPPPPAAGVEGGPDDRWAGNGHAAAFGDAPVYGRDPDDGRGLAHAQGPAYGSSAPATAPSPYPDGPPSRTPGLFSHPLPPRVQHRWGLGAYLLVEAVFLLVSAGLGYLLGGRLTSSAGAVALALAVPTLCAAGLAVLITRLRGNGPRVDLGLRLSRRDAAIGVICGLAGLVITIPASVLYVAIVGADATSAVGDALGALRAGPALAVTIFVLVVFVAPLCEEIVYRGLLWGAVERLGANRWWSLVVTTIVFALAHFEFTRTPLLLVVAIPIGVARMITGRLTAGVIAHQINNLLPGIVLMLGVLGVVPMT